MQRRVMVALLVTVAWSGRARAADPKWEFGKPEPVKNVIWKAVVNGGLVLNTGNANNLAVTAGASASRIDGKNKLQLDLGGTYARSTVVSAVPHDLNMGLPGTMPNLVIGPGDITRTPSTTAELWSVKLRYDRFLTPNNSVFVAGLASGNAPAGIEVAGGGQAGYSRQIVKTEMHLIVTEAGYDYSYQDNVTGPNLSIHSLRLFTGYTLSLTKDIGITAGIEVLCNLNSMPGYVPGTTVSPFSDTRINGGAALQAKLWRNIAFQVSFQAKYTTAPAPLPAFASAPFEAGFVPLAETLDTVTSLSLVITLL